jgi:hypothetical protein
MAGPRASAPPLSASAHSDAYYLSQDSIFQNRVRSSLITFCISIQTEDQLTPFHRERETFGSQVLNAPDTYGDLFTNSISTDTDVLNDATAGGTVSITPGNAAQQAALITDPHIDAAVAFQYNAFFRTPA